MVWGYWQQQLSRLTGKCCPACGSVAIKRFGQSSTAKPRFQCKQCRKTFSLRTPVLKGQQQLVSLLCNELLTSRDGSSLSQLAAKMGVHFDRACDQLKRLALSSLWQVATTRYLASAVFMLPYKGRNNQLWGIVTTDMESRQIVHISTTLLPFDLPENGHYQTCIDAPELQREAFDSAITLAYKQEQRFFNRQQFDRCDFGPAKLAKKNLSHALPVLAAHAHFALLKRLGHARDGGTQALAHEVFLRGACITQYAHEVKCHQMALAYVAGEAQSPSQLVATRKLGWWQNTWHEYRDGYGATKAFSLLCGKTDLQPEAISLESATSALDYIQRRATTLGFEHFTASRVECLIMALAMQYNLHQSSNTDRLSLS